MSDLFNYVPDRIAAPADGDCIDFSDVFGVTATNRQGYGQVRFDGKLWLAHRLAWCVAGRELPPKPFVLRHRCHNPRCVNVDHLEIGTHRDNARDAVAAGTRSGKVLSSDEAGRAYRLALFGLTQRKIAATLGVSRQAIKQRVRDICGKDSTDRIPKFKRGCKGGPGRPPRYRAKINRSGWLPGFE